MNVYLDNAQDYFDAGFDVTPLNGKRPFVDDWLNVNLEGKEHIVDKWGKFQTLRMRNIGLKTGKVSGVICVDVDIKDKKIQQQIYEKLGRCLCGKVGDKEKGINYFFKYNGEESRAFDGIDILSDGKQTVLPPSVHDNGYAYEWIGVELLEAEELPDLPGDFILWCEKNFAKSGTENVELLKGDGRCLHGSHNKLSGICVAMIHSNSTHQEIVDELLRWDSVNNTDVSYFECSSRKEWRVKDKTINANKFVNQAIERAVKNGTNYQPGSVTIELNRAPTDKKKRVAFPRFRGVAQDIFTTVYSNSAVPRTRFSIAATLSFVSMVLGNRIRLGNIHPNLYSLIIGPSGTGKDFPLKFPSKAFALLDKKDWIGQSNPASDSGVLMTLTSQPKRLDTIDEAEILFKGMSGSNAQAWVSKMADVYASLYTSCGEYYPGKVTASQKRVGECDNPYISIIAAMTPEAFRSSFTQSLIEKGLGARFMYFIDEEEKKGSFAIKSFDDVPMTVRRFVERWAPSKDEIQIGIPEIKVDPAALKDMEDYHSAIGDIKIKNKNQKLGPVYNRAYVLGIKLAIIDAACTQQTKDITLTRENIKWAFEFIKLYIQDMRDFINDNVSDSMNEQLRQYVIRVIKGSPMGVTKSEITNKTPKLNKAQRDSILKELMESEKIGFTEDKNKKIFFLLS